MPIWGCGLSISEDGKEAFISINSGVSSVKLQPFTYELHLHSLIKERGD
jgi:hypothetical protein